MFTLFVCFHALVLRRLVRVRDSASVAGRAKPFPLVADPRRAGGVALAALVALAGCYALLRDDASYRGDS